MTDFSNRWDRKESKMDEADMQADEPPKLEVQVHTNDGQVNNDVPLSGLFCVWCHDYAIHIYEGNSLCHECFNKEIAETLKKNKNNK